MKYHPLFLRIKKTLAGHSKGYHWRLSLFMLKNKNVHSLYLQSMKKKKNPSYSSIWWCKMEYHLWVLNWAEKEMTDLPSFYFVPVTGWFSRSPFPQPFVSWLHPSWWWTFIEPTEVTSWPQTQTCLFLNVNSSTRGGGGEYIRIIINNTQCFLLFNGLNDWIWILIPLFPNLMGCSTPSKQGTNKNKMESSGLWQSHGTFKAVLMY